MVNIAYTLRIGFAGILMGLLSAVAGAQVTYDDGNAHQLDDLNGPPNGSLTDGVLVDLGTTLTVDDINDNGQPHVGGTGFNYTIDGVLIVDDTIVASSRSSRVTVAGGTYTGSGNLGLIADTGSILQINGGHFTAESDQETFVASDSQIIIQDGTFSAESDQQHRSRANGSLSIHGGRFTADSGTDLVASQSSNLAVHGGHFSAENTNLISVRDSSTVEVHGGAFESRSRNNEVRSMDTGKFNIHDGRFSAARSNFTNTSGDSELNIYGGVFSAGEYNQVIAALSSTVGIHGGTFTATIMNSIISFNGATLNIHGSSFSAAEGNLFLAADVSRLNVRGGAFSGDTELRLGEAGFELEDPSIHVFGSGFALDGQALDFVGDDRLTLFEFDGSVDTIGLLDGTDVLTGTLLDGSPFAFEIDVTRINTVSRDLGGRIILHIPEPTSAVMIILAASGLLAARRAADQERSDGVS